MTASPSGYVSTGHLPPHDEVIVMVAEAYELFRLESGGENSTVYPAPTEVFTRPATPRTSSPS